MRMKGNMREREGGKKKVQNERNETPALAKFSPPFPSFHHAAL